MTADCRSGNGSATTPPPLEGRGNLHEVMPQHHALAATERVAPYPDVPAPGTPAGPASSDRRGALLSRFEVVRIGSATLIRGDSLDVLECLEPGSIGAVLTDPPYSSGGLHAGDRTKAPSLKYQSSEYRHLHADFVGDCRDQRSFLAWSSLWMSRARLAMRPGALIGAFTDWRQLPVTTDAVQVAGFTWRGIVPWDKTEGVRPQLGRYRNQAEYLVWASNGHRPPAGRVAPGAYRFSVPKLKLHMAAKPVALMEGLLAIMDGPVLDPFMGSSPVGEACLNLGLPYIGIEADPHYFAVACQRLEAHAAQALAA